MSWEGADYGPGEEKPKWKKDDGAEGIVAFFFLILILSVAAVLQYYLG